MATVAGEIARTDGKASLLLAFNGAALAGLASVGDRRLPIVTQACAVAAVLALAAAAVLLLLVVRPRLRGDDRASFPYGHAWTTPRSAPACRATPAVLASACCPGSPSASSASCGARST